MSKINEMLARHKREIEELQESCPHNGLSDWLEEQWAIGHGTGREVMICTECNKVVATRDLIPGRDGHG